MATVFHVAVVRSRILSLNTSLDDGNNFNCKEHSLKPRVSLLYKIFIRLRNVSHFGPNQNYGPTIGGPCARIHAGAIEFKCFRLNVLWLSLLDSGFMGACIVGRLK